MLKNIRWCSENGLIPPDTVKDILNGMKDSIQSIIGEEVGTVQNVEIPADVLATFERVLNQVNVELPEAEEEGDVNA